MANWLLIWFMWWHPVPDWGFFGHRMINRQAVYTIPAPLNQFYKKHAPYLEEHGVDPDKRRYAIPQEYKRHYIDLDLHEFKDSALLSKDLQTEIIRHLAVILISPEGDSTRFVRVSDGSDLYHSDSIHCPIDANGLIEQFVLTQQEEPHDEIWAYTPQGGSAIQDTCGGTKRFVKLLFLDEFSIHGILPYWLPIMQRRLTNAFLTRDIPMILRLSADIGHYIGDAHVPLHTTENYNGQLTGQQGIHGFWESRIPELFSTDWDLVTGPAQYVPDFTKESWTMVRESHAYVDDVLLLERQIRAQLPSDRIMCFEDRNTQNVLTYCPQFAASYQQAMDGMVERRFREAIHAVGSSWYTAWIDGGQPDLWVDIPDPSVKEEPKEMEPQAGAIQLGRQHDN